jgi:hypothetical protein
LVCVIDNLINLTSPLNFLYYNTYDNIRQEKIENLTKKISIRNALKDFFDFKLSNSREFGLFEYNGEKLVRRFIIRKDKLILRAENKNYSEIELSEDDNFTIIGKVIPN